MSLIHEALKKVQTTQRADALSLSGEEAKGRAYFLPAAKAKIVLTVFSLSLTTVLAGWWIVGRMAYLAPHQAVTAILPAKDLGGKEKDNGTVASSQEGRKNDFQTALEAAKTKNIRGIELYTNGGFSLAKNEFLSSIEIFPQYAEAYNNLGLTYKQLGDMERAEDSYKKALKYKPDYPEAMNNYGVVLEAMGNSSAARKYFEKAIAVAPEYPDPYLNMAISLESGKRFEQAINYYQGFLSHFKQGDDSLSKNVRDRVFYLNASRFAAQ